MAPTSSHPPGTLYVVATPIGNLEDITLRALRVLDKEVCLIAAEDTRRTAKLLNHYDIHTKTTSLHEHNEVKKSPTLLRRLGQGDSVAIVSDAGTPLLSDPGARLVRAALDAGIVVQAIPGASAILAALAMSGLATGPFSFVGFPPNRSKARQKWLVSLAEETRPIVMFEAPHRVRRTLADMASIFVDREVAICREITKIHEELVKGPITDLFESLQKPRGEYTIVVAPCLDKDIQHKEVPTEKAIWNEFCRLTEHVGLSRRAAVREIAKSSGLKARDVYSAVESEKAIGQ